MGKNRDLQRRIASLEERVREHRAKISSEKRKAHPDEGLIRFWEREISSYSEQIERKYRRLRRDWWESWLRTERRWAFPCTR